MIKEIKDILGDNNYNIFEKKSTLVICDFNTNNPEDYIEIDIDKNNYIVNEIHRNIKKKAIETVEKNDAIVYASILSKRLFENDSKDILIIRSIRNLVDKGNTDEAKKIISENLDENKYSISFEDYNKISLIKNGDKVDVKFRGENIIENVKLSRGYVVLYNYCKKLIEIESFYENIKSKIDFILDKHTLEVLYMFGI